MTVTYSGKQINRAGEFLRNADPSQTGEELSQVFDVLSYWRLCHEQPLELAFKKLQSVAKKKDKGALFAKRSKRYISIVRKLQRYERMNLKNMQDIGGCRAIVANDKKLRQIVRDLRLLPEFRTPQGKLRSKDYIVNPKPDGYRSYHLVGRFEDQYGKPQSIEVQIRTKIQHYWATALEIIDLFTDQALKSNQGDERWKLFFMNVSKQFHLMESIHLFGSFPLQRQFEEYIRLLHSKKGSIIESCGEVQKDCSKLEVVRNLQGFSGSLKVMEEGLKGLSGSGFVLLEINTLKSELKWTLFETDKNLQAEQNYIKAEKIAADVQGMVVALVSTSAVGSIREAYPNFFADSSMFINYLTLIQKAPLTIEQNTLGRILKGAGF